MNAVEGLGASPVSNDELRAAALALDKATKRLELFTAEANKLKARYEKAVGDATKQLAALMRRGDTELLEMPFDNTDEEPAKNNIRVWFAPKQAPKVEDWEAFHAWIRANDRFDMLHKRVSSAPVVEIWQEAIDTAEGNGASSADAKSAAAGKLPPGVTITEWKELAYKVVPVKKARRAKV